MRIPALAAPAILLLAFAGLAPSARAQSLAAPPIPQLVILDTDIGDDVDDAFALALLLQSPELKLLGITTAWGDTNLRARLVTRFLNSTGHATIPVAAGPPKFPKDRKLTFSQAKYAEQTPPREYPDAVEFLLSQIRQHPGEITLIAIGPQTNLGAAIDRDPATFAKLERIVFMGGSVYRGYDGLAYPLGKTEPQPEWNILCDVSAAQKVFASGVPLFVMPLDSTQIKLQELERAKIFTTGSPLTDQLTLLYTFWSDATPKTPTLFDAIAVGYAVNPDLCPASPIRLRVESNGATVPEPGAPNANVCLKSDSDQFLSFYIPRVISSSTPALVHTH